MTDEISMEWTMPSAFGVEKPVMADITRLLEKAEHGSSRLADILTSVSEACLNALEHGNKLQSNRSVLVRLLFEPEAYVFRIYDEGEGVILPDQALETAEQWGKENPRGWGLYLIRSLADEVTCGREDGRFYVELRFLRLKPCRQKA